MKTYRVYSWRTKSSVSFDSKETAIIYIEQISGIPYRYADDYELIEEEE